MPNAWMSRSVWSRWPCAVKREKPVADVSSAKPRPQVTSTLSSSFLRSFGSR